jgi:cobalt-zinc-cadmium efflux system outer membrane protein
MKSISISTYAWLVFLSGTLGSILPGTASTADPALSSTNNLADTNILTISQAVELALVFNPEMRASQARVDAASGRADQARMWSNPELELLTEDFPLRAGNFRDAKSTVGLSQTVPWPGKKNLEGQIGRTGIKETEADSKLRRLELTREVKSACFQLLAAERLVVVAGELARVAESSTATARKRVAAGAAADQELLRAEIPLEQARTELSSFELGLVSARQALANLLGRPDLVSVKVSGTLAETGNPGLLDRDPDQWIPSHPIVVAAKSNQERAGLELRRARLEPYPDVKFSVAGGHEGGSGAAIVQFGISLPLPIIDRAKGRNREARANVSVAEAILAAAEQHLWSAWRTASQRYRAAIEQVGSYRERILPKANEALRLVQMGFEQGKFGFIDLLDTQRTTAEVRLAYQHKLLELNLAQAELEALCATHADAGVASESSRTTSKE